MRQQLIGRHLRTTAQQLARRDLIHEMSGFRMKMVACGLSF